MRSDDPIPVHEDDSFLNGCLVDSASESQSSGKPVRPRAVAAALVFEAAMVSGLALWPLLTTATLPPGSLMIARLPSQISLAPVARSHRARASRSQFVTRAVFYSPPLVPPRIFRSPVRASQNEAPPSVPFGSGVPAGPGDTFGSLGNGLSPVAPPKPAVPSVRVVRRSERFEEGQLVHRVIPAYPPIARIAGISGTVELLVLVGRDGRVKSLQVLSGGPLLAASAKAGVEQWRYRPTILDGQAVEVETQVTVHFVLDE